MIRTIDVKMVFDALVYEDMDLRLLAILFLPENYRVFRAEDVDDRIEDLMDVPYGVKFEAFKRFFTSNISFSPSTSRAFINAMTTEMEKKTSANSVLPNSQN